MNTVKSAGKVLLFAAGLLVLLALTAAGVALGTGGSFPDVYWRLCAAAGGIVLLVAAVLLLAPRARQKKMQLWEQRFPQLSFTAAILLTGGTMIACAGMINHILF